MYPKIRYIIITPTYPPLPPPPKKKQWKKENAGMSGNRNRDPFWLLSQRKKQDGRPCLWLAETFFTSRLKPLNGIQWNLTGSQISMSSTKFVFFGPIGKQDGHPGVWLSETFSTSPLKPLNGIQRNLTGSKISTSSTKFAFFSWLVNKNDLPGRSVKKVTHCTQVHIMWPFWPLVSESSVTSTEPQDSWWERNRNLGLRRWVIHVQKMHFELDIKFWSSYSKMPSALILIMQVWG